MILLLFDPMKYNDPSIILLKVMKVNIFTWYNSKRELFFLYSFVNWPTCLNLRLTILFYFRKLEVKWTDGSIYYEYCINMWYNWDWNIYVYFKAKWYNITVFSIYKYIYIQFLYHIIIIISILISYDSKLSLY